MHGPRELATRIRRHFSAVIGRGRRHYWRLYRQFLTLYLPIVGAAAVGLAQFNRTVALISVVVTDVGLVIRQVMEAVAHPVMLVMNEVTLVMVSTMDSATFLTAYIVYVWIDAVFQIVQTLPGLPSAETVTDVEVPGGVAVWLLVLLALATYGFVYHQYPTHKDWVGTVLALLLPHLSRELRKSD